MSTAALLPRILRVVIDGAGKRLRATGQRVPWRGAVDVRFGLDDAAPVPLQPTP